MCSCASERRTWWIDVWLKMRKSHRLYPIHAHDPHAVCPPRNGDHAINKNYRIHFQIKSSLMRNCDCNFRFYLPFAIFAHFIRINLRRRHRRRRLLAVQNDETEQFPRIVRNYSFGTKVGYVASCCWNWPIYFNALTNPHSLASICVQITTRQFHFVIRENFAPIPGAAGVGIRIAMMNIEQ